MRKGGVKRDVSTETCYDALCFLCYEKISFLEDASGRRLRLEFWGSIGVVCRYCDILLVYKYFIFYLYIKIRVGRSPARGLCQCVVTHTVLIS